MTHPVGPDLEPIVLSDGHGLQVECAPLGARLTAVRLPDREGRLADVLLGPADWQSPGSRASYFGATCGRYANRIGQARLVLDGVEHRLAPNEGPNQLHGGPDGFDARRWQTAIDPAGAAVEFSLVSPDGDQGYPGELQATVRYAVDRLCLRIEMSARVAGRATVVNLANHAYWNLSGVDGATALDHELAIHASRYLPVDSMLIPTGEVRPVDGTAFDRRLPGTLADALVARSRGFDHCFVVDGDPHALRPMASVRHAASGRGFDLVADRPALQFYSGMHLGDADHGAGLPGKRGARYPRFGGLVFESEDYPDAPNRPAFPSTRLAPGERYRHTMEYRFFVR